MLIGLFKPYRETDNMPDKKRKYKKVHSRARQCIERAIGILKGKFRKLKDLEMVDIEIMCKIIISTCCIHYVAIKCDSNERLYELFRQGDDVGEVSLVRDETFFSLSDADVMRNKT